QHCKPSITVEIIGLVNHLAPACAAKAPENTAIIEVFIVGRANAPALGEAVIEVVEEAGILEIAVETRADRLPRGLIYDLLGKIGGSDQHSRRACHSNPDDSRSQHRPINGDSASFISPERMYQIAEFHSEPFKIRPQAPISPKTLARIWSICVKFLRPGVNRYARAALHRFARDPAAGDRARHKPSSLRPLERRGCRRMDHDGPW
ncbi:MAG: hypothetical protein ACI9AQ_001527, partial [Dinoroseobacter sp.]